MPLYQMKEKLKSKIPDFIVKYVNEISQPSLFLFIIHKFMVAETSIWPRKYALFARDGLSGK